MISALGKSPNFSPLKEVAPIDVSKTAHLGQFSSARSSQVERSTGLSRAFFTQSTSTSNTNFRDSCPPNDINTNISSPYLRLNLWPNLFLSPITSLEPDPKLNSKILLNYSSFPIISYSTSPYLSKEKEKDLPTGAHSTF